MFKKNVLCLRVKSLVQWAQKAGSQNRVMTTSQLTCQHDLQKPEVSRKIHEGWPYSKDELSFASPTLLLRFLIWIMTSRLTRRRTSYKDRRASKPTSQRQSQVPSRTTSCAKTCRRHQAEGASARECTTTWRRCWRQTTLLFHMMSIASASCKERTCSWLLRFVWLFFFFLLYKIRDYVDWWHCSPTRHNTLTSSAQQRRYSKKLWAVLDQKQIATPPLSLRPPNVFKKPSTKTCRNLRRCDVTRRLMSLTFILKTLN